MEGQRTVTSVRSRHHIGEVRNFEGAVAGRNRWQSRHRRNGRNGEILHCDSLVLGGHGTAVAVGHRHAHGIARVAVGSRNRGLTCTGCTVRRGSDIQVTRPCVRVTIATAC